MPSPRLLIVLGVVVAAVVLFVALRPGDGGETAADAPAPAETAGGETGAAAPETAEPPATEPAETDEEATESEEPEEAAEQPEVPTLAIVVRGGLPEGGIRRLSVQRGQEVRIVVRSDAPDELHLHGYELERRVGPGAPAQFRFRADIPGRFELETHQRHALVGELEVRP